MPTQIPEGRPLGPQVSQNLTTPPERPAPVEEHVSDLDSVLKGPAAEPIPTPETKGAEGGGAKLHPPDKPEPEPAKKSLKDENFEKFLTSTEPKKEEPKKPEPEPEVEEPETELSTPEELRTPKQLRKAYESLKSERQTLAEELEALRKSQADAKALLSQIDELKKHNEEMEGTFRVHKYENSRDYQEKFLKPMERVYQQAVSTLAELEVADPEKGSRVANPQDLELLVRLPAGKAIATARELFGDAAPLVLSYREQIKTLYQQAEESRQAFKTEWKTHEERSKAEALAREENLKSMWQKANDELVQKYAEVFGEDSNDDEGNKLISSGRKLADLALVEGAKLPEEQRIKVAAEIRNRAAAFGREVVRRRKAEAQIKELQEKLKAYESSSPDKGTVSKPKSAEPKSPNSMAEALEALGSLR